MEQLEAIRGASYGRGLILSHMIADIDYKGEFEAMARGWSDRDSTSPWELQEEAARVKVRSKK